MTKEQVQLICLSNIISGILSNNTFLEAALSKCDTEEQIHDAISKAALKQLDSMLEVYSKAPEPQPLNEHSSKAST